MFIEINGQLFNKNIFLRIQKWMIYDNDRENPYRIIFFVFEESLVNIVESFSSEKESENRWNKLKSLLVKEG